MYPEERQQAIASLVMAKGRASVTELAQAYEVTTETVRRDLAVLDKAGVVRRVHGGARRGSGVLSGKPSIYSVFGAIGECAGGSSLGFSRWSWSWSWSWCRPPSPGIARRWRA